MKVFIFNIKCLVGLFIILFLISCSETKKVTCSNGEVVFVQKNPLKSFKQETKKTDLHLKGTISILDKFKIADLDAGTKGTVVSFRDTLDQNSIRAQDVIKAAFIAYNNKPCNEEVNKRYWDIISNIQKENAALSKLEAGLGKAISAGNFAGIDEAKLLELINEYNLNSGFKLIK